jgi:hypothetical protein
MQKTAFHTRLWMVARWLMEHAEELAIGESTGNHSEFHLVIE